MEATSALVVQGRWPDTIRQCQDNMFNILNLKYIVMNDIIEYSLGQKKCVSYKR